MSIHRTAPLSCVLALLLTALCSAPVAEARNPPPIPDLTAGGERDEYHDWELGPTGARGWIWGWNLETTGAVQILVTRVDEGSPADGRLQVDDVILGVGDGLFREDARIELGNAITAAEAGDGRLAMTVWRGGQRARVTLPLETTGAYSESWPFDCDKSEQIIEEGLAYISGLNLNNRIDNKVHALALLATGEDEYVQIVSEYLQQYRRDDVQQRLDQVLFTRHNGLLSWDWGYTNLLLTEYYLATEDETILPAIRAYASALARGQSYIGTWGHGMAWPIINDGELHGSLGGYGALNNAGLICHMSLVLATLCGVEDPEVDAAIDRANIFFRYYINRGAIPYGDHDPRPNEFDDNGKCSMAAVIFGLQGDDEAEQFFARMTVASYGHREAGHTGNYFSFMWGALGANRMGPEALSAYLDELRWFYEMNRGWDGGFPYQGGAGRGGGEHSYRGWDSTGAFLLAYLAPRGELYITGRGLDRDNFLTGDELEEVVAAGQGFHQWDKGAAYYGAMEPEQLIEGLSSWAPAVRHRSAQAIAAQGHTDLLPQLIMMLESDDLNTQLGACQAMAALQRDAAQAVPALIAILEDESNDVWLRVLAIKAMMPMREAAAAAVPVMLRAAAQVDNEDPRQTMQRYLAHGLFYRGGASGGPGLIGRNMEDVDRGMILQAAVAILENPDGRTRGHIANVYRNLTFEELTPILPVIVEAVEGRAPSGIMFADGVRLAGLQLLAENHIAEGIPLCIELIQPGLWGFTGRFDRCMQMLRLYGGAAEDLIPQLETLQAELQSAGGNRRERAAAVAEVIEYIRNDQDPPEVISVEDL